MWEKILACAFSFKWNANLEILLLDRIDTIAVGFKQKFVKSCRIYYQVCSFTKFHYTDLKKREICTILRSVFKQTTFICSPWLESSLVFGLQSCRSCNKLENRAARFLLLYNGITDPDPPSLKDEWEGLKMNRTSWGKNCGGDSQKSRFSGVKGQEAKGKKR